jgi:DNA-binding XRE family transcriptional regulator
VSARIRAEREARGWSQQELAARAGVTRQLVGAVEAGRHVPNVAAALGLARALDRSVEELFVADPPLVAVHGDAGGDPTGSVVTARVGATTVAVPLAHGLADTERWAVADAVVDGSAVTELPEGSTDGLVVAGCDPLLGTLAGLVTRRSSWRVITVSASTGAAVAALAAGRVRGIVAHARRGRFPTPPVPVRRWHLARWQVGIAAARRQPLTVDELAGRRWPVVQRDGGAGSQRALERALARAGAEGPLPGPVGSGHLDVARRVAVGGGRAGVTIEPAALAFELAFTPLEAHAVELWIAQPWVDLPAATALVGALTSPSLVARARLLPGYDLGDCGVERPSS